MLLRRGWSGDAAHALLDCDTALALDSRNRLAFFRRLQALRVLKQYKASAGGEWGRRKGQGCSVVQCTPSCGGRNKMKEGAERKFEEVPAVAF